MLTAQQYLETICGDAFEQVGLDREFGAVRPSDRPDLADYQCNGALAAAKALKRNPRQVATDILAHLNRPDLFTVDIAGPGFLNFTLTDEALSHQVQAVLDDPRALVPVATSTQKFLVDYGGPNIAKDMHVGHLRSAIVGQTLCNILRFAGHDVTADVHLGDWGLQIGQLISQIEDKRPAVLDAENPADFTMSDLQIWYPAASARSKDDPAFLDRARSATVALQSGKQSYRALWKRIRDVSARNLRRDYDRLGVVFDQWYGESRYQDALEAISQSLLDAGIAERDAGALIIRMSEESHLPPLFLRNSKGSFGYGATDLATIEDRLRHDHPDKILYVVDARQRSHFQQVFQAAELAGYLTKTEVEHIAFGTVNGTDGKPFKTRAGGVMRLQDLIDDMTKAAKTRLSDAGRVKETEIDGIAEDIAVGAIKFGELVHDRESDYVFDLENFLKFEGKTGPYIQYCIIRLRSLLDRSAQEELCPGDIIDLGQGGRAMALKLGELPSAFDRALQLRKPNVLTNYAHELATTANSFYQANHILGSDTDVEVKRAYLRLIEASVHSLTLCCDLIGLPIPKEF